MLVEHETSVLFLERPDTITGYRRIVANLNNVALNEEQSRTWLATLASELGAPPEEHDDENSHLAEEFLHQPD